MAISEVVRFGAPEISSLNRGTGSTANGVAVFGLAISSIANFFDTTLKIGAATDCARMMHSQGYWMQVPELKLFTERAKAGEYNRKEWRTDENGGKYEYDGKVYGDLKPPVILKWFGEFVSESLQTRIEMDKKAPPKQIEQKSPFVEPAKVFEALAQYVEDMGGVPPDDEEVYRQAKIRDMQNAARRKEFAEVQAFAARIANGEDMSGAADLQYYTNNKAAIEHEMKALRDYGK